MAHASLPPKKVGFVRKGVFYAVELRQKDCCFEDRHCRTVKYCLPPMFLFLSTGFIVDNPD